MKRHDELVQGVKERADDNGDEDEADLCAILPLQAAEEMLVDGSHQQEGQDGKEE